MEKNIHNDPLDDYVRQTFDDHEEQPANNMWSRIESELPAVPAVPAWRMFFLHNRFGLAAAAILLLLSGLVCEHFYYENKLRNLRDQAGLQNNRDSDTARIAARAYPSGTGFSESCPTSLSSDMCVTEQNIACRLRAKHLSDDKFVGQASRIELNSPASKDVQTTTSRNQALPFTKEEPGTEHAQAHLHTASPESRDQAGLSPEAAMGYEHHPAPPTANPQLAPLPKLPVQPISCDQVSLPPGGGFGNVIPARTLSGWYIGLYATPHRTYETVATTAHRPGMRPVFTGQSDGPDIATGWWLRIGKSTGRRWGLESGIGFSESARTTTHTARFRFADGAIHPGGPGPVGQRRNFSYDLNAYGGSASVSLRMESADASAPVAEAEPVVVKISTAEHAQLLHIPLLLTYRMGHGRLTAVVKTGLTGNVFLKNDLVISARTSQNNRLRFAQNADSFMFEQSGNFFLGYWASAGLEFRWSRRLSLVAEPAVSGNFPREDTQGRRLPNQILAGVNVGLNWRL